MSYQTTMARSAAQAAERAWTDHRANCSVCARAQHRRRPAERCPSGAQFHAERQQTAAALTEQRRLDKLPSPDQGTLL